MKKKKLGIVFAAMLTVAAFTSNISTVYAEPGESGDYENEGFDPYEDELEATISSDGQESESARLGEWVDISNTKKVGLFPFNVEDNVTKLEIYCSAIPENVCIHSPSGEVYKLKNVAKSDGTNILFRTLESTSTIHGWFLYIENPAEKGTWSIEATVENFCDIYTVATAEVSENWRYIKESGEYNTPVISTVVEYTNEFKRYSAEELLKPASTETTVEKAKVLDDEPAPEKKGISSSLILLIVVILIVGVGFFLLNKKNMENERKKKMEKQKKEEKKKIAEQTRLKEKEELFSVVEDAEAEYSDDAYTGPTVFEPEVIEYKDRPVISYTSAKPKPKVVTQKEEPKEVVTEPAKEVPKVAPVQKAKAVQKVTSVPKTVSVQSIESLKKEKSVAPQPAKIEKVAARPAEKATAQNVKKVVPQAKKPGAPKKVVPPRPAFAAVSGNENGDFF